MVWFFKRRSTHLAHLAKKEKNLFTTHSLDEAKQNTENKVQQGSAITKIKNNIMKKSNGILLACLLIVTTTISSCAAIEGIFKAGVWVGVLLVVLVVGIIFWIIGKARK